MTDKAKLATVERFTDPDGGDVSPGYRTVDSPDWFWDLDEPVEAIRTIYRYSHFEKVAFHPIHELCETCDGEETVGTDTCPTCKGDGRHPFAGEMEVLDDE